MNLKWMLLLLYIYKNIYNRVPNELEIIGNKTKWVKVGIYIVYYLKQSERCSSSGISITNGVFGNILPLKVNYVFGAI